MGDSVSSLAAAINNAQASSAPSPTVAQGVVTSWNTGTTPPTVGVQIAGAATSTNLQYAKTYTPTIGDTVQLIGQQGSWLVFCAIAQNAYPDVGGTDASGTPASGSIVQATSATASVWSAMAQGSGASSQCVSSGGVNRTNQPMFWYANSVVVTVSGPSGWDWASSGVHINGIGVVLVSPGDTASGLVTLSVSQAHVYVDGSNNLHVGGAAYYNNGGALTGIDGSGGSNIRVNILALCW